MLGSSLWRAEFLSGIFSAIMWLFGRKLRTSCVKGKLSFAKLTASASITPSWLTLSSGGACLKMSAVGNDMIHLALIREGYKVLRELCFNRNTSLQGNSKSSQQI
mmetsp:Transcript_8747/g.15361  ORF Transcript_8747/g.15361 Transcript_8747/m.15361 type:complete len:105 (+) Transcript_8747:757-1071(+)